jgi:DNA-binding protein HU-beta
MVQQFKIRYIIVNKSDLIAKVATASNLSKADAERAIDAIINSIARSLETGEEVRLIGFGTFEVRDRKATEGRNPRTGAKIKIPASRKPSFRAGKQLREAVAK